MSYAKIHGITATTVLYDHVNCNILQSNILIVYGDQNDIVKHVKYEQQTAQGTRIDYEGRHFCLFHEGC